MTLSMLLQTPAQVVRAAVISFTVLAFQNVSEALGHDASVSHEQSRVSRGTGQRYDVATGTYHFLFRTYSPPLGRWLQRDPIGYAGGSMNLYEYVASSPINAVDTARKRF